jgi:hypothetical protein
LVMESVMGECQSHKGHFAVKTNLYVHRCTLIV